MKLETEQLSEQYRVRPITNADVKQVLELCKGNPLYYEYCPPFVTEDSIRRDMKALPPQKGMEDKYYLGYYQEEQLIAVMDLICGYPDTRTVFIGFFMTDIAVQGQGVGSKIIGELCDYLGRQSYKAVKLGWIKGNNQSEGFWHKNLFLETGISYDINGYTVIVAQRNL